MGKFFYDFNILSNYKSNLPVSDDAELMKGYADSSSNVNSIQVTIICLKK